MLEKPSEPTHGDFRTTARAEPGANAVAPSSSSEMSSTIGDSHQAESSREEKSGYDERAAAGAAAEEGRDANGVEWVDGYKIVSWDGEDDPDCPLNMPFGKKWLIVLSVSAGSFCVTCCSSMIGLTYAGVEDSFGVSREVATLGISIFVIGLGLGPLFLGPLSEFYGRNIIYRLSYFFFVAFQFPVAFAPNITSLLFGRFLSGVAGAAFLSVAGGTVSDVFRPSEISTPMAIYSASPFMGPVLGPAISGAINQKLNWRWTWYVFIIWAGVTALELVAFVPETYAPTLLQRKAERLRRRGEKGDELWRATNELQKKSIAKTVMMSCLIPFEILLLEPMALLLNTWTALLLGILYLAFGAFPIIFGEGHGFNTYQNGLSFLGIGVGNILGVLSQPIWTRDIKRIASRLHADGKPLPPEIHLRKAMVGGVLVPTGLYWIAGSSTPGTHWIVPIIGSIPFGVGILLVYQGVFTFLVAAFRPYAASAMASNSFMRSSFAAGFPLFTVQMYRRLGTIGATMLLAGLMTLCAPLPFIFYRVGERLRKRSKFSEAR